MYCRDRNPRSTLASLTASALSRGGTPVAQSSRGGVHDDVNRLVVASDFSESADAAFLYGRELAIRFGARVHLLHVAQDIDINMIGAANYPSRAPAIQNQIEEDARRRL